MLSSSSDKGGSSWINDEAGYCDLYVSDLKTAESCKVAMSISLNDDEMFKDVPPS
jgi:hypothetical protein